jgi:hypothetical protein
MRQRFFVDAEYGKTKISSHGWKNGRNKHTDGVNEAGESRRGKDKKADNALRKARAELRATEKVVNEAAAAYKCARVGLKKQKAVIAKQQPHVTASAVWGDCWYQQLPTPHLTI